MGFWDNMRASQATMPADWHILDTIEQLATIQKESFNQDVVLFKHSTTCGISAAAKNRLEMDWTHLNGTPKFYYLDLLSHRPVSNAIAENFKVVHQSPQIILLRNGKAVYSTSHHRISIADINSHLQ
jgi:bacillithiol system protein YtxJ